MDSQMRVKAHEDGAWVRKILCCNTIKKSDD